MKITDNFIRNGIVIIITIISVIGFFNLSKIIGLETSAKQNQPQEMTFGSPVVSTPFRVVETELDKTNPGLPYLIYDVKYITFKTDTIGGEGLPQYEVIDRYYQEGRFGVRGKFNLRDSLPNRFDDVLEVIGTPTFAGVQ